MSINVRLLELAVDVFLLGMQNERRPDFSKCLGEAARLQEETSVSEAQRGLHGKHNVIRDEVPVMNRTACNRCGRITLTEETELCWYCQADLCFDCWNEYGHCGHPAADAINEKVAAYYAAQSEMRNVRAEAMG